MQDKQAITGFLGSISKKPVFASKDIDFVYFLLAKEFGIDYSKLKETPLPYIFSLLNSYYETKEKSKK